jgi:hypothetical protein
VDDHNSWLVRQICDEVRRYLDENLRAADSLDGVATFWVRSGVHGGSVAVVQRALDLLTAAGRVSQETLPDGRILYRATGAPKA